MIGREFKTLAELDSAYAEHIDSLRSSGLPFDEKGLLGAWAEAVLDFQNNLKSPRSYTDLP